MTVLDAYKSFASLFGPDPAGKILPANPTEMEVRDEVQKSVMGVRMKKLIFFGVKIGLQYKATTNARMRDNMANSCKHLRKMCDEEVGGPTSGNMFVDMLAPNLSLENIMGKVSELQGTLQQMGIPVADFIPIIITMKPFFESLMTDPTVENLKTIINSQEMAAAYNQMIGIVDFSTLANLMKTLYATHLPKAMSVMEGKPEEEQGKLVSSAMRCLQEIEQYGSQYVQEGDDATKTLDIARRIINDPDFMTKLSTMSNNIANTNAVSELVPEMLGGLIGVQLPQNNSDVQS